MKGGNRLIGAIACGAVLVATGLVGAGDWPQWRGANRDRKVTGFTAPETWPKVLTQKWKVAVGSGDGAPAVANGKVVTLAEKSIVGIGAADGKLLWQLPFVPGRRAYNAATPIVDGQTVIYTGAGRGTTAVKIEKQADGLAAKKLWRNPDVATQYNTPVLKDGLLFGLSNRGNLFCLNAQAAGKTAWVDSARRGRGFGAMVDVGSVILALPSTSELIAFKPSGEKYEEVARIKIAESSTYAHPVIVKNRAYVKDSNSVTMWAFE